MTGFELWISRIGINRTTNGAITNAPAVRNVGLSFRLNNNRPRP